MSRRQLALAYAVALVPALAMAVGQPVWSRVDEPAHYDVIAQYASGVYPRDSVTTVRTETLVIMEKTGVYGFVVDNAYQRPDIAYGYLLMPSGLTDAQHVLWARRHVWQYSYEAFQPPLYYALAIPAWKLGDALGGPFGALYAVRIFDALLAALLAPLALLLFIRVFPAQPQGGWAAVLLTAAMPGVAVNLTSVTNDVLVTVLGALTLVVALGGRVTLRRAALTGLLLGLAFLAKTTAVALLPAVLLALLYRGRERRPLAAVVAVAAAAAVAAPWLASNVRIYGELITTREQLAMSAFPVRTAALDFWSVSTLHAFVTFWSGDPFLSLATAVPLALLGAALSALALAGLVRAWRSPDVSRTALAVLALAGTGAGLASVTSPVLAAFNAPGRLAYVGLGAVTALVGCGLWFELRTWRLTRGAVGLYAVVSLIGLAALAYPAPPPAAKPGVPNIATTAPLGGSATFADVQFRLLACAVDVQGDLWLDVYIDNTGTGTAEWSQSAEVLSGGQTLATSDYSHSAQLPMVLLPYLKQSGWLWLGPASRLHAGGQRQVDVRFRDIAAADYHYTGDVVIPTPLC